MSFHDILLPSCLEVFLVGKSAFTTSKIISASGREVRSLDCPYNRAEYRFKDCLLSQEDFVIFNNFFKARRGSRFAFMLKDYADFRVDRQALGTGDGAKREFQLCKTYQDGVAPYVRKITKIVRDGLRIQIGEAVEEHWQINERTGVLTMNAAPVVDAIIYASFQFYVPVRFASDSFDYEVRSDGTIEIQNLSLIEVLE